MSPIWLTLYLILYAVLHSVLATIRLKSILVGLAPGLIHYYRFLYVVFSVASLLPLFWLPLPTGPLYALPAPLAFRSLQMLAAVGFLWSLRHTDLREFLGLGQILRRDLDPESATDENPILVTGGPYRLCRHPLYFFSAVVLVAQPVVNESYAVFAAWSLVYFLIGSRFEEGRMLRLFGNAYRAYQSRTPRFIPRPRRSRRSRTE